MSRYGGGRSSSSSSSSGGAKVYVGNLGNDASKTDLERAFGHFGHLRHVWVARNPPGFAFIEFEDPRDAADAVKELDDRYMYDQCFSCHHIEMNSLVVSLKDMLMIRVFISKPCWVYKSQNSGM